MYKNRDRRALLYSLYTAYSSQMIFLLVANLVTS